MRYFVNFDEVFDEILNYNEEKIIFHRLHIYDLFGLEIKTIEISKN
jgi:DNA-binding CsgD family transcriptional regulator